MALAPVGPPPESRPRRGLHDWLRTNADQVSPQQARMDHRLAGITTESFWPIRPQFCTTQDLNAPRGFDDVWHRIQQDGSSSLFDENAPAESSEAHTLIIFTNLMDVREVQSLAACIDMYGERADMFIVVTHSSSAAESDPNDELELMISMIDNGADDIIFGTPSGPKLACAIRARLQFHNAFSRGWSNAFLKQQLLSNIHSTVWDYLRVRLDTHIPDIDPSIVTGEPACIEGYHLGKVMGKGAFGKVVELTIAGESGDNLSTGQVVKCISKTVGKTTDGLKELKNQIIVMECCSTEKAKHPNIVQLLEVYHSKSHVFLRMESGGPEDLAHRLQARDSKSAPQRLLSGEKVKAMIMQCSSAVAHLHGALSVAHRDLKPDNIIVIEDADTACIKLTDFGLAKIVNASATSRSVAGTLPYMSPEMVLESKSNVFFCDIWSLGITFLDLICMSRFIERHVFRNLPKVKDETSSSKKQRFMRVVHKFCQAPGQIAQLLQTHQRPELQELHAASVVLLEGVLNVSPTQRWTYKELLIGVSPESEWGQQGVGSARNLRDP